MQTKEYELQVILTKSEPEGTAIWHESALVDAESLVEAHIMAQEFARQMARENRAKVRDSYAIDHTTGEQS